MLVVDTSIVVPLYVRTASTLAVKELYERDDVWRTEPFALIELSNVLATYERAKCLAKDAALAALAQAASFLLPNSFTVMHEAALECAFRHRVTAYDGRFLALADQLQHRLVTEDRRLRAAAPELTQSLAEALATR